MVWHHSLLLMNSFNITEAVVFSCRLCFQRAFPLISLIVTNVTPYYIIVLLYFSDPRGTWIVCYLHLKSFVLVLGGVSSVAFFITTDEQLQ